MHTFVLEKISNMYEKLDSVMITNRFGVIEYSANFDQRNKTISNNGYTGKNILEIYPELTKETSSHFRAIRTGRPIIDEIQHLTDFHGKKQILLSSTYPIDAEGEIIGAIEGTVYLDETGAGYRHHEVRPEVEPSGLYTLDSLITRDKRMLEIKDLIERVAGGESHVMINGRTGTGKEVVAQAIHAHSQRANEPFISQNCAAIPANLLESTLFGTTKGSYTGAEDRKGILELANRGTLFLDEINSMAIALQSKILKAIEEQKIRRIGDEKEYCIDVRIVSALNEKPEEAIKKGKLRDDLFYRLGVVQIHLPDLCERKSDIPVLTQYYMDNFNRVTNKGMKGCSELVSKAFMTYDWPGNVRELRNAIEYAFNVSRGDIITIKDIPESVLYERQAPEGRGGLRDWTALLKAGLPLTDVVNQFEKELIVMAVESSRSTTEAAKKLNITRQALNYKLAKYGLGIR